MTTISESAQQQLVRSVRQELGERIQALCVDLERVDEECGAVARVAMATLEDATHKPRTAWLQKACIQVRTFTAMRAETQRLAAELARLRGLLIAALDETGA